jgi:hypothetical protein
VIPAFLVAPQNAAMVGLSEYDRCAINDVLDFGGHFLSLGRDSFFKRGGFSTATRHFTHNQGQRVKWSVPVTLSKPPPRPCGLFYSARMIEKRWLIPG